MANFNFLKKKIKKKSNIKIGNHSIISNISDEVLNGPMRGWICGHFYPKKSVFHRKDIEICLKVIEKGMIEDEHFHLCSFEFLIVLDGEVEYCIGGVKAKLLPGMFYFLEPGTTEFINRVIKKTTILAVRLPSIPNNKIFTKNIKNEK
jgi:mannose-6-phosphate isomerase-like protein (cupin superfamily)